MTLSRDNKPEFFSCHKAAATPMRTSVTVRMTRTNVPVILADWKKEAAP